MRVLVSANDSGFAALLDHAFRAEHYVVDLPRDWDETRSFVETREYDLAFLDMSSSGDAGPAALLHARSIRPQLPILVLIRRSQIQESARLLAMGADDFVFPSAASSPELLARARAVLGRGSRHPAFVLRVQDLEFDATRRVVSRAGKTIHLTSKEYSLLEYLMRNAGRDVTRQEIIEHAWNLTAAPQTNVVEVYINYLRKKIDGDSSQKLIQTIRGTGYRLQRSDGPEDPSAKAASA